MTKNNNITKKFTNTSDKKYNFFLFVANASCIIPVVPNRCAAAHWCAAATTPVCREAMLLRHQKFCLAFRLFFGVIFWLSRAK